jgi:hypothetical protein
MQTKSVKMFPSQRCCRVTTVRNTENIAPTTIYVKQNE